MQYLTIFRLQSSEVAQWSVMLTYCINHTIELLPKFIEQPLHFKLYKMLARMHKKGYITNELTMNILSYFLNIASNNDYFDKFEQKIGDKALILSDLTRISKEKEEMEVISRLRVLSEDFLYLVVKILFEWDLDSTFKICYLRILKKAFKYSYNNALSCNQGKLTEYLLICLRIETSDEVKHLIAAIISKMFRISVNASQLKCLLRVARIDYHTLFPDLFVQLIPPELRKAFSDQLYNTESYLKSVQLIFGHIFRKILTK